MDGNYSSCLPQRLARATGLILLDLSTPMSLWRYARRTWFERDRRGALDGGRDSVKWSMIRHIAVATPPNRSAMRSYTRAVNCRKCCVRRRGRCAPLPGMGAGATVIPVSR